MNRRTQKKSRRVTGTATLKSNLDPRYADIIIRHIGGSVKA